MWVLLTPVEGGEDVLSSLLDQAAGQVSDLAPTVSYIVVYTVLGDVIFVVRILHGALWTCLSGIVLFAGAIAIHLARRDDSVRS